MTMATLQLVRLRAVQPHASNPGAVPMQSSRQVLRMHLPFASSLSRPVHPWGGVRLGGGTRGREILDHLRVSRQPLLKAKPSNLQVPTASFSTSVHKVEFVTHEVKKAVLPVISIAALFLNRICVALKECPPPLLHTAPAVVMMAIAVWGLTPIMRSMRRVVLKKVDTDWENSRTETITNSYIRPLLLWAGVIIICRASDPIIMWSEASQEIKQRFINFVRSLSTVLAIAFCTSSLTEQVKKSMMDCNLSEDPRNMSVQFIGNAVYTSVWVAAACLFMELLGFSTQKWLAAGGFGTVLLTLAGREIFTNFLSSMMIHATKPFVESEWIQTKIEGQEVSGTVEHVGWWSPTVVRGDDREAVHIPNHKFSVSVVRNLTQKTHWRIKTHIGISHLDVNKVNGIVSDMRKVLTKHTQVEQQRLHRRVFFDQINPENQALLILVSCFVKTSHFEEYLSVKETILLDLLKVISHHNARLATPIRSMLRVKEEGEAQVASANSTQTRLFMLNGGLTKEISDLDENDTVSRDLDQTKRPLKDSTPRKRDMLTVATDTKEKSDLKRKVSSNEKTLARQEAMPSSISKSPLEGIELLGLKSKDTTLLGAAFGKAPANFHEGSMVQDNEKLPINAAESSIEGDKKMVVARFPGQSKGSQSKGPILEKGVNMMARDSEEAAQENVSRNPVGTGAPRGVDQKDRRKEQREREDSRLQSGHRMQGGEENLVLGVALNGHRRTRSLEDLTKCETAPTEELRDLVSTRSGTANTGIKDRKDVAATQPDLPGSVPDGKGQAK